MRLNEPGIMVMSGWEQLNERFPEVKIDAHVVMPNHIHGIIWLDRGRNSRLNPAAPPSEPYVRIYRIRLSGRWFTSGRIDRLRYGLQRGRTTPVQQRKHFASVDGRPRGPYPDRPDVS